jgi:hypothetical protein
MRRCDAHNEQREESDVSMHHRCREVNVDKLLVENSEIVSCRVMRMQPV